MKKINLLLLAIIAIAVTFTACNTETNDYGAPTIVINQADQTVDAGQDIIFTGTVASLGKIKEVRFFTSGTQLGETVTSFSNDSLYTFSVPISNIQETFEFKVQATDDKDQQSYETVTITVSTAPATEVKTLSNVALVFDNSTPSACTAAFTLADGVALNAYTGDGAKFDIVFVYNSITGYSYGSPDADQVEYLMEINGETYATTTKHTKFMAVTGTDYTNATVTYIEGLTVTDNLTLTGLGGSGVEDAVNGATYAFETNEGVVGLFKITHAKVTASSSIEVKYVGAVVK